jgi:site-specific recombinase XerC
MRPLNYELKQLGLRNRDGSFVTQANRAYMLSLMATQLAELGYQKLHAPELKSRHATALVRRWQAEGLAPGTVKNRLSALRWWAEKIGRPWVLVTYLLAADKYNGSVSSPLHGVPQPMRSPPNRVPGPDAALFSYLRAHLPHSAC